MLFLLDTKKKLIVKKMYEFKITVQTKQEKSV